MWFLSLKLTSCSISCIFLHISLTQSYGLKLNKLGKTQITRTQQTQFTPDLGIGVFKLEVAFKQ